MSEVYADRRVRLRDRCAAAGSPAALVSRPANVRYLAGGSPPGAVLLVGPEPEADVLLRPVAPGDEPADGRLDELLRQQVLPTGGGDPAVAAVDLARRTGADALAVEEHHLTVARHRAMGAVASGPRLTDLDCAVEQLRIVKDEDEIACLRIAAEIADQALGELLESILVGGPNATSPWSWNAGSSTTAPTGRPSPPRWRPDCTPAAGATGPPTAGSRRAISSPSASAPTTAATAARSAAHLSSAPPRRVADRAVRARLRRSAGRTGVLVPGAEYRDVDRAARRILKAAGHAEAAVPLTGHGGARNRRGPAVVTLGHG